MHLQSNSALNGLSQWLFHRERIGTVCRLISEAENFIKQKERPHRLKKGGVGGGILTSLWMSEDNLYGNIVDTIYTISVVL